MWLYLHNSVWTGAMNRTPTPTECTLRIVYAQSMFIPRTRNIYPRTPTFTPRTPTVGSRFIVPAYHGTHAVDCPRTPMFICECPIY